MFHVSPSADGALRTLIDELIDEQRTLTPVESFAAWHDRNPRGTASWRRLIPASKPGAGEQYAFEVDVSACTGCKACVSACHSLNGLDEGETWRDVGLLLGGTRRAPVQQIVTTACHHCGDPACANGCPVLAYDKDAATGIVRHLDDQCIGCQYCILKCPYDVPKYSKKRGIVRKCDLCTARLAEGEAPACVQACPNEAIRVVTVKRQELFEPEHRAPRLTPDAFSSGYTKPATVFTGLESRETLRAADAAQLRVEHTHWPLVWMLWLTQSAVGLGLAALVLPDHPLPLRAAAAAGLMLGVAASTLHLGQPLKAWRAFLGWRKSWLSREILAFGAAAPAAGAAVLAPEPWTGPACLAAVVAGLASVACSVMVYADTRRALWSLSLTSFSMLGTMLAAGTTALAWWTGSVALQATAAIVVLGRVLPVAWFTHRWRHEDPASHPHAKSARLFYGPLHGWWFLRLVAAVLAVGLMGLFPAAALALVLVAEWAERVLFFKAVVAWRMPGTP